VDLYVHSHIRIHGVVLNLLSTGTTLHFTLCVPYRSRDRLPLELTCSVKRTVSFRMLIFQPLLGSDTTTDTMHSETLFRCYGRGQGHGRVYLVERYAEKRKQITMLLGFTARKPSGNNECCSPLCNPCEDMACCSSIQCTVQ
jgi:hypothetical protein